MLFKSDYTYHEYVTVGEASEILRLHPNTVYLLIQSGKLKAWRLGRSWRLRREDLRESSVSSE